jgi:hypothetical protein
MPVLRLAGLTFCLYLALIPAILAAMFIGRFGEFPGSLTQLHLLECLPPCWIGIVPGTTTVAEAKARIVATYAGQDDLSIKDAGFAGVPIHANVVEINIEGKQFFLYIRLNISELIDGKNEIVQSIGLFETRADKRDYAPTVSDILATFGRPRHIQVEALVNGGADLMLHYEGWYAAIYSSTGRVELSDYPRFYLGN